MMIFMKRTKLFMMLLIGVVILFSGCNNDDDPVTYSVTVTNEGNGTAEADKATAEAGATVELTATAADGYVFSKWTVESGDITLTDETANPATFTMPASAVSVKAEFTAQKKYSIYLAGCCTANDGSEFGYTQLNDVQIKLPTPTGGSDASAISMVVSGGKAYVVGRYYDSNGRVGACYWKDGVVTKLEGAAGRNDDMPDYAAAIAVSDNKIYVTGHYYADYSNWAPCYWVDGVLTTLTLPAGATSGAVYSIGISGGKIYMPGYAYEAQKKIPGYWLDDAFVSLNIPDGASFQIATGMDIVVADKVYIMGTYSLNSVRYPCVWVDGVRTELALDPSANGGAYATSLAVADGKVYVVGYSVADNLEKACYWADGTRTNLDTPDNMFSSGMSIGVIDGKVYVGGRYYDSSYTYKPCYWFDGERIDLDIPTGGIHASIKSIYVSE